MAKNYFNRYVWLIDIINRHGHISREEICRLWKGSLVECVDYYNNKEDKS